MLNKLILSKPKQLFQQKLRLKLINSSCLKLFFLESLLPFQPFQFYFHLIKVSFLLKCFIIFLFVHILVSRLMIVKVHNDVRLMIVKAHNVVLIIAVIIG